MKLRPPLVDQIFDFEAAELEPLACFAQAVGGAFRFRPIESRGDGHEFGDRSASAGYYDFAPALDLVEKHAEFVSRFERSDLSHFEFSSQLPICLV
jgi:hypothetical protein